MPQRDKLGHFCIASLESFLVSFLRQAGSVDTLVLLPRTAGPRISIAVIHLHSVFSLWSKNVSQKRNCN